ncbi:MAG: beta-galactosidase [Phycisphaerales bacterium]|jgi:hypothetical protein|nr:beta-galactosidase [Phycisphaerales bacterium]
MPSITYDGRSFMLDGRRLWLVCGSIHYARVPSRAWPDRIHAAKLAGVNTIVTPVFWNLHESRPGSYKFDEHLDLRHFVELIGRAGMRCILHVGPYVGAAWDLGGLPAWLSQSVGNALRGPNQAYLEACSRFITAVAGQVRDLQATSPRGGPIIAVQNEANWTCGDDQAATAYLGELHRYIRESGLSVPVINTNNLWTSVEGEVDAWAGSDDMLGVVRQLGQVTPDHPRFVASLPPAPVRTWDAKEPDEPTPGGTVRKLAQVLAGGGQFNLDPFHGGTTFGFWGGRLTDHEAAWAAATHDRGAPLDEAGVPSASFHHVRRLCTFASRFTRVFSHLDPAHRPVMLDPEGPGVSVAHVTGTQGGVAFVFGRPGESVSLLLPEGVALSTPVGASGVSWVLFDAHLTGYARLTYSSLPAIACIGKSLLCFGPAGSRGMIAINGSPVEVEVPRGDEPLITELEGVTLVVVNEALADLTYITDEQIVIGAAFLTPAGEPVPIAGRKLVWKIDAAGHAHHVSAASPQAGKSRRTTLTTWECAPAREYVDGSSPRFASIKGPDDLASLGSPYGYGWYRIQLRSSAAKRQHVMPTRGGDRLHVFTNGEGAGIFGLGPGAQREFTLALPKGDATLVVLADNLGRYVSGANMAEAKGLADHLWHVVPLKAGRATIEHGDPIEPLKFRSPLWEMRAGDTTHPARLTWKLQHRRKTPIILLIETFVRRGVVILNDEPIHFLGRGSWDRVRIDEDKLRRGNNVIQIALLDEEGPGSPDTEKALHELAKGVRLLEGTNCLTEKATWAFAKWEPPSPASFEPATKARGDGPTWWRTRFQTPGDRAPTYLDASGLTKGQIFLNDRNVCRYWAQFDGSKGGQKLYLLPSAWMRDDGDNELVIFDEQGGQPAKASLVVRHDRPTIVAYAHGEAARIEQARLEAAKAARAARSARGGAATSDDVKSSTHEVPIAPATPAKKPRVRKRK